MTLQEIRVLLPFVPHSLKNNLQLHRERYWNPRTKSMSVRAAARTGDQVVREQFAMTALLREAVRRVHKGPGMPWPEDEVEVEATRLVGKDQLEVVFRHAGAKPKGRTGRDRDTQNLLESLLDAAQGVVYSNDNQVRRVAIERRL